MLLRWGPELEWIRAAVRLRIGLTCGVFLRVFDHYKYSAAGVFEQSMPRARLVQIYILTSNLSTTYPSDMAQVHTDI